MKILFSTDGSKISYEALNNFLYWVDSPVIDVICVADWTFLPDNINVEGSDFAIKCANSADSILEYSEKFIKDRGAKLGCTIKMCGVPVDAIIETEQEGNYDYLVMGSNGKKGFQKWLGSVSQELASVSKTSVFVSKGINNSNSVLFALDSSELSENVILKSIENLNLVDKEISLLTVYEMPEYLFLEGNLDSNWVVDVERKQKAEALKILEKYEKIFSDKGIKISYKSALKGRPSQVIEDYSRKHNIDLVVTGVRNKKYYSRFFISSVSKRVLENVDSDVLIIRP